MLAHRNSWSILRLALLAALVLILGFCYHSPPHVINYATSSIKDRVNHFKQEHASGPGVITVTATQTVTATAHMSAPTSSFVLTQNPIQVSYDNTEDYDFVVIGLHSLGSQGDGMRGAFKLYDGMKKMDGWDKRVKWIWPSAYKGKEHSWYQLTHKEPPLTPEAVEALQEDESHIFYTSGQVKDLINEELRKGVSSKNIFVWGFSQGCVMSLFTGLTLTQPLGGIFGINGYLPLRRDFEKYYHGTNRDVPVYLIGGEKDGILSGEWTKQSAEYLRSNLSMTDVEFEMVPDGVHKIYIEQYEQLGKWLIGHFKKLDLQKHA